MTSSAPISAADREKLGALKQKYNNALADRQHAGGAWSDYQSAVMGKADAYEARVVELEAALAAKEAEIVNYQGFLCVYQDDEAKAKARAEASAARATALLEALEKIDAIMTDPLMDDDEKLECVEAEVRRVLDGDDT